MVIHHLLRISYHPRSREGHFSVRDSKLRARVGLDVDQELKVDSILRDELVVHCCTLRKGERDKRGEDEKDRAHLVVSNRGVRIMAVGLNVL
jgi:hypothetical protein